MPVDALISVRGTQLLQAPEKPLIGADRYEEIIEASVEARGSRRGSSVASGRRSVQGSMTNLFQVSIPGVVAL